MKKEYLKPQTTLVHIGTVVMQSASDFPGEGAIIGGGTDKFGAPRRGSLVDFDDDDDYLN